MAPRPFLCLAAALLCAAAACGPSREQREAASVLRAADALRDAPSAAVDHRRELLGELERQPASTPAATAARDACVRAYRPLLEGNALTARVAEALKDPAARPAPDVLVDLATAEEKVKESAAAMPACEAALADLRRALR